MVVVAIVDHDGCGWAMERVCDDDVRGMTITTMVGSAYG